jgi:hypothetical protein
MSVVGKTVAEVRRMTLAELEAQEWEAAGAKRSVAVVFTDGTKLFAASGADCERMGAFFAETPAGEQFTLRPSRSLAPPSWTIMQPPCSLLNM